MLHPVKSSRCFKYTSPKFVPTNLQFPLLVVFRFSRNNFDCIMQIVSRWFVLFNHKITNTLVLIMRRFLNTFYF